MSIITIDLCKTFDRGDSYAISRANVFIRQGEFIAVVGPPGAGKSTFLKCLDGTLKPSVGKIIFDGKDPSQAGIGKIGTVCPISRLEPFDSVREAVLRCQVSSWRRFLRLYSKSERDQARKVLEQVELFNQTDKRVMGLTEEQKLRLAIACALAGEPRLLLVDEPRSSFNPRLQLVMMGILSQVNRVGNVTVLIATRETEIARDFVQRIIAFQDGVVVYDGEAAALQPETVREIYSGRPLGLPPSPDLVI